MDELISRQAAIEAINGLHDKPNAWLDLAVDALEDLPSVQPEPKWIPVTERLPEKDGMFLVSISPSSRLEKRVDTDFYSHFGIWQIFGRFVTAWMPLPNPWKGGEDESLH